MCDARGNLRYAGRFFARRPAIFLLTIVGLSLSRGIATAAFAHCGFLRGAADKSTGGRIVRSILDGSHKPRVRVMIGTNPAR